MSVTVVKELSHFTEIIKKDKYTVFDFWATWCGPCRVISPIFEELAKSTSRDKVEFYKVDVDDATEISEEVGIRAMPTFMLFKDGKKIDSLVGADPTRLGNLIKQASA